MKRIAFLLLAALSFAFTAGFTGLISHLIPSPAEFIAALVSAVSTVFVTYKISKYRGWPVAVFALILFMIGLSSGLIVKKMIHAESASSALEITVDEAETQYKKDFYSFTDSRIDFDKAGYYLLQHYGDHHYYAFPVLGDKWREGDPVAVWTWARTRKAKDIDQQRRLLPVSADYGLRVREYAIKVNVKTAIEQAAESHGLNVPDNMVILHWGTLNSVESFWPKLLNQFLIFMSIVIVSVLLQMVVGKKRSDV